MTLLKLEFKSLLSALLVWTGIIIFILVLVMAFFPSVETSAIEGLLGTQSDAIPSPLLILFGLSDIPDLSNISVYFAYIMQYIAIAIAIYGALLGTNALVKEETNGTIEYLYAQPITRSGIVVGKLGANFLCYFILVLTLGLLSAVLNLVFSSGRQEVMEILINVKNIYIGVFLSGFIFMVIGFLASVRLRNAKKTGPFALAMVFATLIIGFFASLVDSLDFLQYLSPLNLFNPSRIVTSGFNIRAVGFWSVMLFIVIVLIFVFYNKKELRT